MDYVIGYEFNHVGVDKKALIAEIRKVPAMHDDVPYNSCGFLPFDKHRPNPL